VRKKLFETTDDVGILEGEFVETGELIPRELGIDDARGHIFAAEPSTDGLAVERGCSHLAAIEDGRENAHTRGFREIETQNVFQPLFAEGIRDVAIEITRGKAQTAELTAGVDETNLPAIEAVVVIADFIEIPESEIDGSAMAKEKMIVAAEDERIGELRFHGEPNGFVEKVSVLTFGVGIGPRKEFYSRRIDPVGKTTDDPGRRLGEIVSPERAHRVAQFPVVGSAVGAEHPGDIDGSAVRAGAGGGVLGRRTLRREDGSLVEGILVLRVSTSRLLVD
jgi:hypothetical protein